MNCKNKKSNLLKIKLLFALCCISIGLSFGQTTTLKGTLKDASTNEPIGHALVGFENSSIWVQSQENGTFTISNRYGFTEVKIQTLGYKELTVSIAKGETTVKEILLEPRDKTLSEVIVKPRKEKYSKKNNPAVDLIKKVIANKHKNNISALDFYQYKEYERYVFAFDDFNNESGYFKNFKFLTNYVDSSLTNNKPILPFSVKEKVTDVFYRKNPSTEKRIVKGKKSEGIDQHLEQQGIEAIIDEAFRTVNISDNYITMLFNNFVSPLSDHQAVNFYKWYLGDTIVIDDDRYVNLEFAPFNNRDIGFTGNLYISLDSAYAVKKAVLRVPKNININFVSDMVVIQEFGKDRDGQWIPQESRTAMDLTMYNAIKAYVEKTITVEDFMVNMPIPPIYDLPDPELYEKDYLKRPDDFWIAHRPETHQKDYRMGEMMEEMRKSFLVRFFLGAGNIIMTGYIPIKKDPEINKFEIGTVPTFFSYNNVEGARVRVTGTTTKNLHPHLSFFGYAAYGFKDEKIKYMGEANWSFRKIKDYKEEFPVNNLSLGYKYDVNALGQRFTQAERDNIFMSLNPSKKSKMTYIRQVTLAYHKEFHSGFSFKIQTQTNNEVPARNILFEQHHPNGEIIPINNINTTETSLKLRYAHNEKFFQRRRRRVSIPTERFITEFSHTVAIKDFLGGQYNFNKTSLSIKKDFWITPFGKLNINAKGEKLWGKAPFMSLISPGANNSYTLQSGTFYMINPLEFMHDKQVSCEIYYHLNGFLFNRIPVLKHLKWREIVGIRGLYGSLSDKNNPVKNNDLPVFPEDSFQTKGHVPYMEYNIGIENILSFFRIDYVRRINYLNQPDIDKYGFRFSFEVSF